MKVLNVYKQAIFLALLGSGFWLLAVPHSTEEWPIQPEIEKATAISEGTTTSSQEKKAAPSESDPPFKHIRVVHPSVQYDANRGGWQYDTLLFVQRGTERVLNTIPVRSLDPFGQIMNETVEKDSLMPPRFYEISEPSRAMLRSYIEQQGWAGEISTHRVDMIRWEPVLFAGLSVTDYVAVGFHLYLLDEQGVIFAILAEYRVLNKKGEVTASVSNKQGGMPPIVSQDGKWLAVRYGEEYEDYVLPMGMIFFDLQQATAVYRDTTQHGWWCGYYPVRDYIVNIENIGSGSLNNVFTIYKLEEGKKYTRRFDENAGVPGVAIFEEYQEDGVYYPISRYRKESVVDGKRIRKWASFADDFEVSNLQKLNP
jgi:hypothetical protein